MYRRLIPVLCALAVAVVPTAALAQPAQDPSPAATHGGVVYGDTKYDLQNQQDQKSATATSAYEQAISGDTKGNLPRAIAPAGTPAETPAAPATPVSTPTASHGDNTNGWQIAALAEAAFLAALAIGAAALVARRQGRAPHMGV
jgi:hypothetical protein